MASKVSVVYSDKEFYLYSQMENNTLKGPRADFNPAYHVLMQDQKFVYDVLDICTNGSVCQNTMSLEKIKNTLCY